MKVELDPKYCMAVQSRDTGRILLQHIDNVWCFAPQIPYDNDTAMLFALVSSVTNLLGLSEEQADDLRFEFIGLFDGTSLFHATLDGEPMPMDDNVAWYSLFDFPENFDSSTDAIFNDQVFMERLVSPAY